jgi:hypothetical protein
VLQVINTVAIGGFAVLIILYCCCRCCRRKPKVVKEVREVHTIERISSPERIVEHKIVERVLVVCPFCGHKNQQGLTKCQECGADI